MTYHSGDNGDICKMTLVTSLCHNRLFHTTILDTVRSVLDRNPSSTERSKIHHSGTYL